MAPEILIPEWPPMPGVRAAFTLRGGGVSRAPFDTLNVAMHVGDAPEAVLENRRRVRRVLGLPGEPVWLTQVHGVEVVSVQAPVQAPLTPVAQALGEPAVQPPVRGGDHPSESLRADAAVTRTPGQVCAIQVADCIPVLLAARDGSAVGAAHAGWRGVASGVLEAAVQALRRLAAEPAEIIAWLGPGIGPSHFEVGDEVRAALVGSSRGSSDASLSTSQAQAAGAFTRNARGRWQCDLGALAHGRLQALSVREIYGGHWCTYADARRFFSYRRDGRCGRMAALIWREG